MKKALSKEELREKLISMGEMYHIYHPFHIKMNNGKCTKNQIQGWVANRFYYQCMIPIKDASILSNNPPIEHRRKWIQRMLDHDSVNGGIDSWLQLGIAVGLNEEDLISHKYLLPGVKFAIDAYVNFSKKASWEESMASSLTELFAPEIHKQRLKNWPKYYKWIDVKGLQYFQNRLSEARRDVEHGLQITIDTFKTYEQQQHVISLLQFKLDILWTMLDSMYLAYELDMPPYFNIKGSNAKQRKINSNE